VTSDLGHPSGTDASSDILGAIFADQLRGEDVGWASAKSRVRITDNSCQWLGHRWRGARSACRRREAARVGIVRYSPANRLRVSE
jgi:hypothetical protein